MSSRRGKPKRASEFYPTPPWCVELLLSALAARGVELPGGLWAEPAAGAGDIVRAVESIRPGRQRWAMIELRRDLVDAWNSRIDRLRSDDLIYSFQGDFLDIASKGFPSGASVIITNPPYSKAEAFARACIGLAGEEGFVAMLLRLSFLESDGRIQFHEQHPAEIFPIASRPSFTGDGKTDSSAYAWFCWGKGTTPNRWNRPIGKPGPAPSRRRRKAAPTQLGMGSVS